MGIGNIPDNVRRRIERAEAEIQMLKQEVKRLKEAIEKLQKEK